MLTCIYGEYWDINQLFIILFIFVITWFILIIFTFPLGFRFTWRLLYFSWLYQIYIGPRSLYLSIWNIDIFKIIKNQNKPMLTCIWTEYRHYLSFFSFSHISGLYWLYSLSRSDLHSRNHPPTYPPRPP